MDAQVPQQLKFSFLVQVQEAALTNQALIKIILRRVFFLPSLEILLLGFDLSSLILAKASGLVAIFLFPLKMVETSGPSKNGLPNNLNCFSVREKNFVTNRIRCIQH